MPHSLSLFSFFIHILSSNFLRYFMVFIFPSPYFSILYSVFHPRSFPFLYYSQVSLCFSMPFFFLAYSLFILFPFLCNFAIFLPFHSNFYILLSFCTSQLMSFLYSPLYVSSALTLSLHLFLSFAKTILCFLFLNLFIQSIAFN